MPGSDDRTMQRASTGTRDRFAPPVRTEDVFRSLIEEELRTGRLSASRRRRIVRYAAAMGLDAAAAGELITQCRDEALKDSDPRVRQHAMRLIYPDPPLIPAGLKLALAAGIAIALDVLLVAVLWG